MKIVNGIRITDNLRKMGFLQGDPDALKISVLILGMPYTEEKAAYLTAKRVCEEQNLVPETEIEVCVVAPATNIIISAAQAKKYFEQFVEEKG